MLAGEYAFVSMKLQNIVTSFQGDWGKGYNLYAKVRPCYERRVPCCLQVLFKTKSCLLPFFHTSCRSRKQLRNVCALFVIDY